MSQKWWTFFAVACGTFMATLDTSIVNIALSALTRHLTTDLNHVKWVVIIYFLTITCLLLPMGRISDQVGHKKVFCLGFVVFTLGSTFCGLSNTILQLIFSRALQGVGAAMLMANGPAIITEAFPSNERGAALGNLAMVVSIGLISGPSLGGILIKHFGWKTIFLVNVPVGILGALLTLKYVKSRSAFGRTYGFDWKGTGLQSLLLILTAFLFEPHLAELLHTESFPLTRWWIALIVILLFIVFYRVEKKQPFPVFDFNLLKNQTFRNANLGAFFLFIAYSSVAVLIPYFLEEVLLYPTDTAGFIMTAIPIVIFVVAPISGRLSDYLGSWGICVAGALIQAGVLLALSGLIGGGVSREITEFEITMALCGTGLGLALFQSPNNNAIMGAVPREELGMASAVMATIRNLGLVVGSGLSTGFFAWRFEMTSDFFESIRFTFLIAGFVAAGAALTSLSKSRGN